ncbi:MAG: RNA polymerase Rpb4 family protein [Candidatus Micrarchaeota archaeon]
MKVTSSHPVSLAEVEELLSKRKKEDEELAYEQQQSLEHAEKFKKGSAKDAEKLVALITKNNEKISQETAVKIADIMPKKLETLKAILIKDKISLSDEEVDDVFKLLHL